MLIDCDDCAMQHTAACDDCVVTCLLDSGPLDVSENFAEAVDNLAEVGLVPKLRLVPTDRQVS